MLEISDVLRRNGYLLHDSNSGVGGGDHTMKGAVEHDFPLASRFAASAYNLTTDTGHEHGACMTAQLGEWWHSLSGLVGLLPHNTGWNEL